MKIPMMMKVVNAVILLFVFTIVSAMNAQGNSELKLSPYFTDNMVLQHGQEVLLRGVAPANRRIVVTIDGKKLKTKSDANHQWYVRLPHLNIGGPYTLNVTDGRQTISLNNVLVGDVWFCSGQSNMEFMLKQTPLNKMILVDDPNLRLYNMTAIYRTNAVEWESSILDSIQNGRYYNTPNWNESTSETAPDFSAVAYYFGKMLRDSLNIPIGLVCNAIGGSPTESWIEKTELASNFPSILMNWESNDLIQDWVRSRGMHNIKKASHDNQLHPYMPGYLYETGVKPFKGYPIKGVIWYQGESNAHNVDCHKKLFSLLVNNWRRNWENDTLPFYYVQLSSLNRETWPEFRNSQREMLYQLPYSGMVVSSDHGDSLDVHPVNKQPIGERLAKLALSNCYHKDITPSGPLFKEIVISNDSVLVYFDYGTQLTTSDGKSIRGFEIASEDGTFYPANAVNLESYILLYNDKVKAPKFVRYGWQPYTTANLINKEGLPASTFQSSQKIYQIDYSQPSNRSISTVHKQ